MTEETFKKICLCLKYNLVSEVKIQDLKDNLYELQKKENYHVLLNKDEMEKQEYDLMLDGFIKNLEENHIAITGEEYFYFYELSSIFKNLENEFNTEERKMYLDIIQEFIKLNCEKYQNTDKVKKYRIKRSVTIPKINL